MFNNESVSAINEHHAQLRMRIGMLLPVLFSSPVASISSHSFSTDIFLLCGPGRNLFLHDHIQTGFEDPLIEDKVVEEWRCSSLLSGAEV
jgi:hypothetical protein